MDELEEIRQKKLQEMQQRYQEQVHQQAREQQKIGEQITALENMVKPRLDKKAIERYGTLKTAHPEKAVQSLLVCAQLLQSGKTETISDEEFKNILIHLEPAKRETRIKRI